MSNMHTIRYTDGETEDCWCSFGENHDEGEGDWNLIDVDDAEF